MGTDRSLHAEKSCPCGKGTIRVYYCEPDHGWPSNSIWFSTTLDCDECSEKYVVEDRSGYGNTIGPVVLVERTEVEARKARRDRLSHESQQVEDSEPFQRLVDEFVSKVGEHKSTASAYRWLSTLGSFTYFTEGTFRRHIKNDGGLLSWTRKQIHWYKIPEALEALSKSMKSSTEVTKEEKNEYKNLLEKIWPYFEGRQKKES